MIVDDCGRLINPMLAEGQVHGGAAQGIGQALMEAMPFSADRAALVAGFDDYAMPHVGDLPSFETGHTVNTTKINPLGVRGVGEGAAIGASPALVNAVLDALRTLDVRDVSMPMTPMTVWRAIQTAEKMAQTEGTALLAGGQSLLRDMKRGLRHHATLVDLGCLLGRAITVEPDFVEVEAAATHVEVAASNRLQGALPLLSSMAGHIADPMVRHRATIGGAFAAEEAAGDYPALALALNATIITIRRPIAADEFFTELGATALEAGEISVSQPPDSSIRCRMRSGRCHPDDYAAAVGRREHLLTP